MFNPFFFSFESVLYAELYGNLNTSRYSSSYFSIAYCLDFFHHRRNHQLSTCGGLRQKQLVVFLLGRNPDTGKRQKVLMISICLDVPFRISSILLASLVLQRSQSTAFCWRTTFQKFMNFGRA